MDSAIAVAYIIYQGELEVSQLIERQIRLRLGWNYTYQSCPPCTFQV